MRGGNAAFCQITLTTCYYYYYQEFLTFHLSIRPPQFHNLLTVDFKTQIIIMLVLNLTVGSRYAYKYFNQSCCFDAFK